MQKNELLNFINRYHLAGAATSVKWDVNSSSIKTRFITDDQNVIGEIQTQLSGLGINIDSDHELGVYATPQLVKMLSACGDTIEVDVNAVGKKTVSLDISDTDIDMTFVLADLNVIPPAPELKRLPDFNVRIAITKEFMTKFIKSKNALPDSDNFGVSCTDGNVSIIINHSSLNTNRIVFNVPCNVDGCDDMNTICFSSNLFKEILQANKDAEQGELCVSAAGLAMATFSNKDYSATYYLVQLQTA